MVKRGLAAMSISLLTVFPSCGSGAGNPQYLDISLPPEAIHDIVTKSSSSEKQFDEEPTSYSYESRPASIDLSGLERKLDDWSVFGMSVSELREKTEKMGDISIKGKGNTQVLSLNTSLGLDGVSNKLCSAYLPSCLKTEFDRHSMGFQYEQPLGWGRLEIEGNAGYYGTYHINALYRFEF